MNRRLISATRNAVRSAAVVVIAVLTAALVSSAYGQEKSAEELATALKARFGAEWEIPATLPEKVVACEQTTHKVMIFKTGADWNDPESVVWEWAP